MPVKSQRQPTARDSPYVLSGIDAAHPQVASWQWTVPTLAPGDPGHYCMAVFVHSASSPITGTRMNLDVITPVNPQIGQKNLHIGAPLPPTPAPGPGPGGRGGPGDPGSRRPPYVLEEYIEFYNPTAQARQMDLLLEISGLPPHLRAAFRLSRVETATPLQQAIFGVSGTHEFRPSTAPAGCLVGPLLLLLCRLVNAIRALFGRPPHPCGGVGDNYPGLSSTVYEARPASPVRLSGIRLTPFGSGSLVLRIHNAGDLPPGAEYPFHVHQLVGGTVGGGSQFVVRIQGEGKQPKAPEGEDLVEFTPEELKRRLNESRHLPGWIKEQVERREKEQGRFP